VSDQYLTTPAKSGNPPFALSSGKFYWKNGKKHAERGILEHKLGFSDTKINISHGFNNSELSMTPHTRHTLPSHAMHNACGRRTPKIEYR
jgi:hypothetical protein